MNESDSLTGLRADLAAHGDLTRLPQLIRYFQAFAGEYGEGDRFLGVRVPDGRKTARRYRRLSPAAVTELLTSVYHEERLTALLIMVEQYQRGDDSDKRRITTLYLDQKDRVNNWDLVDTSADKLLGRSVLEGRAPESLWDDRIAMLSTFAFIRAGRFGNSRTGARRQGYPSSRITPRKYPVWHFATPSSGFLENKETA